MTESYKELMGRITVTTPTRQRILNTLRETPPKTRRRPGRRAVLGTCAIAACLILVIASVIPLQSPAQPSDGNLQTVVSGITEVNSFQELSETVGFPVEELSNLPFSVRDVQYSAYDGQLAQVTYQGDSETITFRKIAGSEDPSGDYTDYPDLETITVGATPVALKGDQGQYRLAVWDNAGYSYSIQSSSGYPPEVWCALLQSFG